MARLREPIAITIESQYNHFLQIKKKKKENFLRQIIK